MNKPPLIVVSPDIESAGKEFADLSISLSANYQLALLAAGALPLALPVTTNRELIAECVRRSDGIVLSGGDDVEPRLYGGRLPAAVRKTVHVTADAGARDLRELTFDR